MKVQDMMASQANSVTFKEELTLILLKLLQNTEETGMPQLILQGLHHLDTKTRQIPQKEKITGQYH